MASLSGLRTLVYAYLGTTSSDPAYPASTVNALINAAGNALIADIHQQKPDYLVSWEGALAAQNPTSRNYTLPSTFAGWVEVRLGSATGTQLTEVRREELELYTSAAAFSVTGTDGANAILTTSAGVESGVALWMFYRYQPSELVADADVPTWLPTAYHDLLARKAAIDAFGLGNESAPSPLFVATTADRETQFWVSIGRRGVGPTIQR